MALEKNDIKLGLVPLIDAAPLIVAKEKGFFEEQGLNVTLSVEASWASIRDKVAAGLLDAAHMLAPMPIAATAGIDGVGVPMMTALFGGGIAYDNGRVYASNGLGYVTALEHGLRPELDLLEDRRVFPLHRVPVLVIGAVMLHGVDEEQAQYLNPLRRQAELFVEMLLDRPPDDVLGLPPARPELQQPRHRLHRRHDRLGDELEAGGRLAAARRYLRSIRSRKWTSPQ